MVNLSIIHPTCLKAEQESLLINLERILAEVFRAGKEWKKISIKRRAMNAKSVKEQSPHVGVDRKFGDECLFRTRLRHLAVLKIVERKICRGTKSSRGRGVEICRVGCQLSCHPRHLTLV
ncbi:hypothetical protein TNCV_4863681 [Trichonephila clavipes]|nr:hypothetical protein TNCV_4863681 [Trichonephila clavipes]